MHSALQAACAVLLDIERRHGNQQLLLLLDRLEIPGEVQPLDGAR